MSEATAVLTPLGATSTATTGNAARPATARGTTAPALTSGYPEQLLSHFLADLQCYLSRIISLFKSEPNGKITSGIAAAPMVRPGPFADVLAMWREKVKRVSHIIHYVF